MNSFNSENNKKLLYKLLSKSKININDSYSVDIIKNSFNHININYSDTFLSLLELNKKFIKTVIENKKKMNKNFLTTFDDRLKGNIENLQERIETHNKDFDSYKKKVPVDIDFKDKNEANFGSIEDKINKTMEERKQDLEFDYKKKTKSEDFQNDSIWLSQEGKDKKEKIKISKKDILMNDTIVLKSGKKVRFEDDQSILKTRITKLEKDIVELKRLIREVLSENMMKSSINI